MIRRLLCSLASEQYGVPSGLKAKREELGLEAIPEELAGMYDMQLPGTWM